MFTLLLCIAAIAIFFKVGTLAFKLSWGIIKIVLTLVLSPIIFIVFIVGGLLYGALIVLVIMGIVALISGVVAK